MKAEQVVVFIQIIIVGEVQLYCLFIDSLCQCHDACHKARRNIGMQPHRMMFSCGVLKRSEDVEMVTLLATQTQDIVISRLAKEITFLLPYGDKNPLFIGNNRDATVQKEGQWVES